VEEADAWRGAKRAVKAEQDQRNAKEDVRPEKRSCSSDRSSPDGSWSGLKKKSSCCDAREREAGSTHDHPEISNLPAV